MSQPHRSVVFTADRRAQIITALAEQPGGRLLLFFTGHGLGEVYQSGSRGYGRAHRVGVVLARADVEGRLDELLRAAADHFGIKSEAEETPEDRTVTPEDSSSEQSRAVLEATSDEQQLLQLVCAAWVKTGQWPEAGRLQRNLEKLGARLEVEAVARRLDPRLGSVDHNQERRIVLRVAGLAACPHTSVYLTDFIATVRLLYQRYLDDDADRPEVTDAMLRSALGLDDNRLARVHELLTREFALTAGSTGSTDGPWTIYVSMDVRRFRDVASVADYLTVLEEWFPSVMPTSPYAPRPRPPDAQFADLHPLIVEAAGALFADGHFGSAVFDAFKAVEVRVRELTSLELTGRDLMAKAFELPTPRVPLSTRVGLSGRSEQEGYRFLFMGAMQGIRNIEAHDRSDLTSTQYAMELLALASLLMRRLDIAATASSDGVGEANLH